VKPEKSEYQDAWERAPGLLYFVAAGSPPVAVKIGVTKRESLKNRLRAIQTGNHETIEVLGLIAFDDEERPMLAAEAKEKELHAQFAELQRFQHGWVGSEWFTAAPVLLNFIVENAVSPESLQLPRVVAKPKNR
jgi:hypothetical protein